MQEETLKYWLALHRAPGIGPASFQKILDFTENPEQAFRSSTAQLEALGLQSNSIRYLCDPDWTQIDQDLEWLQNSGNHILTIQDPSYPELLREIHSPPPLLFIHGHPEVLSGLQLAIVGSRNPTATGRQNTHDFSLHLATAGMYITSGLALGVDTACHRGALDAGGITIAVTGTGLDRVYPARNRDLAHEIAEHGALVSEFPPGVGPMAENFPRRNRIISGLSLGTLVVEAALKSGSLITARYATEQGREVFAIPGSIHNPLSRGCHRLIREGAKLVETAEDILSELGPLALSVAKSYQQDSDNTEENSFTMDADYENLLSFIGYDPISIEAIITSSGLTPEEVSSMLLILELHGIVATCPGGTYLRMK